MEELERYKDYLLTLDISENTRKSYLKDVELYIAWCERASGDPPSLAFFSFFEITQYRSYLLNVKKYKASTVNRKMISIRDFCKWAQSEGLLDQNPAEGIKEIKDIRSELAPVALEKSEVFKLRRAVHRYGSKRDAALIELMLNAGPRASEVSDLKPEDLDISERKGALRISGKGGKVREVPINSETRKYLRDYLSARPNSPYLFVSQRGSRMERSTIFRIVKKYAALAGIEKPVHPHTLRHTFAQTLIDNGADLFTVQHLLGHEDISTTQRYHRPKREVEERAVENMYS